MGAQRHLHLVHSIDRGEIEIGTALARRFLGMAEDEPTELTFLVRGRTHVAHAMNAREHVRLLREAEQIKGFNGAYQLVNGPINPALLARYAPNRIHRAWNGRVGEGDIRQRRAIYIDIDPVRPKGIGATHAEKAAAFEVCEAVEAHLETHLGDACALGHGDSGNGYFILIALQPVETSVAITAGIQQLLRLLAARFNTPHARIDVSVANVARLMPAPGTWKCKGENTPERPYRRTAFSCRAPVRRVSLETILG
ncbi:MAG TPA: hypothetical protein VFQ61_23225 [Polyangiaceae bacterium]|nr:hypothetical protein [Polyangiaceae bacterium]